MARQLFSYSGKVAVVTGASRGIGRSVTELLAKKGCHVAAVARPSALLQQTVAQLTEKSYTARVFACDLSNQYDLSHLAEQLIETYGRIDILVNCAGVGKLGPILDMTEEDIQAPLKVPLEAAISLSHKLLPAMINRSDSRIINIVTPAAYFDLPFMAAYTASRAGLLSFTRSLDEELHNQGVRVKAVCPAWVDTGYLENNQSDGNWYPKVSKYFPTISTEQAADYVLQAIEGKRRELKTTFLLKVFELCYRCFPGLSVAGFKLLNVYKPTALAIEKKNRPGSEHWTNWEESIDLKAGVTVLPKSIEEIINIIKDSNQYPSPVRAAGSRHTTTHCGVADQGTLMIMRKMDKVIEINKQKAYVTVQAGALYIDVARALREHGLQFYVNVEIGNLTMGSAACTGTKDASMPGEFGQVCSYCTNVKMVTAAGKIQVISEDEPELMSAVRSSYGLLGVIFETTFKVKPIYAMSVRHQSFTVDEFEAALPQLKLADESMMYYLFPFQNRLTVEFRKYHKKQNTKSGQWLWLLRNLFWKTIAPAWSHLATRFVRNKTVRYFLIDKFYGLVDKLVCTLLSSSTTIATDQIIRYPEHKNISKYTFSIWAFPEENIMLTMRAYYKFCQDYYRQNGFRCDMLNVGYRISQDKNPLFSYSHEGTVMTLDPVTTGSPGWDEFLKAYNEFCSLHNGVPLFNQSKWLTTGQVQKAFDRRISKFWQFKVQLDSKNRFLNDYFRQLFEPDSS